MKIKVTDFDAGVDFTITAANDTERAILIACIDGKNGLVRDDTDDFKFVLTLQVSN